MLVQVFNKINEMQTKMPQTLMPAIRHLLLWQVGCFLQQSPGSLSAHPWKALPPMGRPDC